MRSEPTIASQCPARPPDQPLAEPLGPASYKPPTKSETYPHVSIPNALRSCRDRRPMNLAGTRQLPLPRRGLRQPISLIAPKPSWPAREATSGGFFLGLKRLLQVNASRQSSRSDAHDRLLLRLRKQELLRLLSQQRQRQKERSLISGVSLSFLDRTLR
jgi:hypothetical protein